MTSEEHCSDRSDITAARYCGCPRDGQTEIGYRAVERHAEREREREKDIEDTRREERKSRERETKTEDVGR